MELFQIDFYVVFMTKMVVCDTILFGIQVFCDPIVKAQVLMITTLNLAGNALLIHEKILCNFMTICRIRKAF